MRQQVFEPAAFDDTEAPHTGWIDTLNTMIGASSRHVALLAAWIALCGSLFFSEVLGWQPCLLCWYQRILMYPLAVILAVGILRRDRAVFWYVLPLSIVGAGVSLYHYLLIMTDWFPAPPCTNGVSCTVDYINWFGFIRIPLLAFTAFLIISVMMVAWASYQHSEDMDAVAGDDDEVVTPARSFTFDNGQLAVVLIIVGVVASFVLGSTVV